MEFLFRLFAATGPYQPTAIRGADLLSVIGLHDAGWKTGCDQFQY